MAFWKLDPQVDYLNHGSFGACPEPVLQAQQRWREQTRGEPVRFFLDALEPRSTRPARGWPGFVGAEPGDLAFVHNATTAVNAVLRALDPR